MQGQVEASSSYEGVTATGDGVRVSASVEANVYTWVVENIDAPPIVLFEMPQKNCYNQRMPVGWTSEYEDDLFRAWTEDPSQAIRPGHRGEFTTRVSSTGAVLGHVSMTLGASGDHVPIVLEPIWGPVRKPRSIVVMVAFIVAFIAVAHTATLMLLSKRKPAPRARGT